MNTTTKLLKAITLSVSLLGSAAIVAAFAMPDAAYAKGSNGNGGGNGGGNGNSGGNGSGGQGGGSNKSESSKSSKSSAKEKGSEKAQVTKQATKQATKKAKSKDMASQLGVSASELGALNAAHASPNALKNASPNSRVGRIAAYRDAVLDGRELQAELDEKQARLDEFEEPLNDAVVAVRDAEDAVTELEEAVVDDPTLQDQLDAAVLDLEAARQAEADLRADLAANEEYVALTDEVADLGEQIEDQPELERDLLEAAANKPVDDAVEAAVKALLGL